MLDELENYEAYLLNPNFKSWYELAEEELQKQKTELSVSKRRNQIMIEFIVWVFIILGTLFVGSAVLAGVYDGVKNGMKKTKNKDK